VVPTTRGTLLDFGGSRETTGLENGSAAVADFEAMWIVGHLRQVIQLIVSAQVRGDPGLLAPFVLVET
jgi:hypothetical protein